MPSFEAEVRCEVFARVWVDAKDLAEARQKVQYGGGYWGSAEFEKNTARTDTIESITNLDAEEPEEPDEQSH